MFLARLQERFVVRDNRTVFFQQIKTQATIDQ